MALIDTRNLFKIYKLGDVEVRALNDVSERGTRRICGRHGAQRLRQIYVYEHFGLFG